MTSFQTSASMVAIAALLAVGMNSTPALAASFVASQTAGEQSTSSLIGLRVVNSAGEALGDINYFVVDTAGKITTVVIGVGGFLGVAEKNIGVPYSEVTMTTDKDGKDVAKIDATKENLTSAPAYVWTEKSTAQRLKEGAEDLAKSAKEGAETLADKAKKAADDMQAPASKTP